jgi:hypothetical protein
MAIGHTYMRDTYPPPGGYLKGTSGKAHHWVVIYIGPTITEDLEFLRGNNRVTARMIHNFTLLLVNLQGNLESKLHNAGFNDCLLRSCEDQYFLDCERVGDTREEVVELVRDTLWAMDIVSLPEQ